MKKVIIATVAILVSTLALASEQSVGFSKNSTQLNALGKAFKVQPAVAPKINPNDITMGYGGEDVSSRVHLNTADLV